MTLKLVLALVAIFTLNTFAQTPEEIGDDFQERGMAACAKLVATLEREGTAIAAKLVSQGDTAGAAQVSEQVKAKINGANVPQPHAAVTSLFGQYNMARETALKPVQTASLQRLDALLKSTAGKDMQNVMKIAKVRETVVAGKLVAMPAGDAQGGGSFELESYFVEKSWYSAAGTE